LSVGLERLPGRELRHAIRLRHRYLLYIGQRLRSMLWSCAAYTLKKATRRERHQRTPCKPGILDRPVFLKAVTEQHRKVVFNMQVARTQYLLAPH